MLYHSSFLNKVTSCVEICSCVDVVNLEEGEVQEPNYKVATALAVGCPR